MYDGEIRIDTRLAPHTWRCFFIEGSDEVQMTVSSTYVEMFPYSAQDGRMLVG